MAKGAIEAQIEFIKKLLRKGGKRNEVLAKFVKQWQKVSVRTFDRRLEAAEEAIQDELRAIQRGVEESIKEEIAVRKIDIMKSIERQEILTQIARGEIVLQKPMVVDKFIEMVPIVPDWADRRSAIAELNKMDGDYAAMKIAATNPDGTPIEPQKVTMTPDQLEELKKSIESKNNHEKT